MTVAGNWTAGPWRVADDGVVMFTPTGEWRDARAVPVASGFREDAYCAGDGTPESRANARLIAAAPDLYEALASARSAIASLDEYALGGVDIADTATGESVGQYGIRDELLSSIDAALAKARGEQPS